MKGLWSEHFSTSTSTSTSRVDISPTKTNGNWSERLHQYQRCLLCPVCNASICRLKTSNTPKNPDRQFYKCPTHDNFFKWADEVNPNQLIDVPNCGGCGAGACRVRRETIGPNAGRILFMCRVKEGEGSCGYRVWQDELKLSETGMVDERISSSQSTINFDDISTTDNDLVEESKNADKGENIVTPMINTSEHFQCREIISPKMGQLKCQEDKPVESSRRPHKRSRYGDVKASGSLVSTCSLKVRLSVNNVPIKYSWMRDAIRQNLSSQLHGWWGRLAFHPRPCYFSLPLDSTFVVQDPFLVNNIGPATLTRSRGGVKSYSKPLFNLKKCRNTLDYMSVVQENIMVNPCDSWILLEADSEPLFSSCRHQNTEPFRAAVDVPSLSKTKMTKSISNTFCQAAQHLQKDLLTLLETMDVKDHVAMRQAAEATFAALDHLYFSHQDFRNRVNELIHCASSLSEIEQSMPTNDSYQRLIERCSSERTRLEEINCVHAETTYTLTNKKKHLRDLREEISSTLDWLLQIEAEISCFEVEMRHMELDLERISRDKEELEGKYSIAFKELEVSNKFLEQKEAEFDTAKAAYDRAIALLRG
ncbi:hypothetical protein ACS0TY_011724 [Phlomoides rotata]